MPRNSSSNVIRIEVTLHKEKHADIIKAMEEYDSQAGFLKFVARQYIKEQEKQRMAQSLSMQLELKAAEAAEIAKTKPEKEELLLPEPIQQQKRRLPPGMGQSQSRRLEE